MVCKKKTVWWEYKKVDSLFCYDYENVAVHSIHLIYNLHCFADRNQIWGLGAVLPDDVSRLARRHEEGVRDSRRGPSRACDRQGEIRWPEVLVRELTENLVDAAKTSTVETLTAPVALPHSLPWD